MMERPSQTPYKFPKSPTGRALRISPALLTNDTSLLETTLEKYAHTLQKDLWTVHDQVLLRQQDQLRTPEQEESSRYRIGQRL